MRSSAVAGFSDSNQTGFSDLKGLLLPLPFKGKGKNNAEPSSPSFAQQYEALLKLRQVTSQRLEGNREAMQRLRERVTKNFPALPWRLTLKKVQFGNWSLVWKRRNAACDCVTLTSPDVLPELLALPPHTRQLVCDLDREVIELVTQVSLDHHTVSRLDILLDRMKTLQQVKDGLYQDTAVSI